MNLKCSIYAVLINLQEWLKGDIIHHRKDGGIMSPRKSEFTERINVFFTPDQLERIKAEAEKHGLTVSAYVRMVVVKVVNENGIYLSGLR